MIENILLKDGYILVKPDVVDKVTKTGFILSQEGVEDAQRSIRPTGLGVVVKVSNNVKDVSDGQYILYSTWSPIILSEKEGDDIVEYHLVDAEAALANIEL